MPKTILVADDSVTIRKVVELTFRETGIRVESVANGREALARLTELRPDLVLADVVMPEPNGYEICRAVKSSERPVPVLLLAGTFEPFDDGRAADCGADGHVVKPFESRALLARVEEMLARHAEAPSEAEAASRLRREVEDAFDELALPQEVLVAPAALDAVPELEVVDRLLGPEPFFAEAPVPADDPEPAAVLVEEPPRPAAPEPPPPARLSDEEVDRIARVVIARLSDSILREIAWEVVPDLAETVIRERLRQIERADADPV